VDYYHKSNKDKSKMECPHGGDCIDPGNPSDCLVNGGCVCFDSADEKAAFDALPKNYRVRARNGEILTFTTQSQVDFYITDFGGKRL
jgi:hypothetical protein